MCYFRLFWSLSILMQFVRASRLLLMLEPSCCRLVDNLVELVHRSLPAKSITMSCASFAYDVIWMRA